MTAGKPRSRAMRSTTLCPSSLVRQYGSFPGRRGERSLRAGPRPEPVDGDGAGVEEALHPGVQRRLRERPRPFHIHGPECSPAA